MLSPTLQEAYGTCRAITRQEARNFYYGIRLLPEDKRNVLCAVYALARRIDDIGDGDLPPGEKRDRLAAVRADVAALPGEHDGGNPVLVALADAVVRYPIPLDAFAELVDGVQMDVEMDEHGSRYATFDDLVTYCRCVAGSVGRLCLGVFGGRADPKAAAYADALGIALQQTNVLRDIREDLVSGRVYLPQEDLDAFGVELRLDERGALVDDGGALSALVRACCARAQGWYDDGLRLVPLLDRRSAACCLAMSGIYRRLTERIAADPSAVLEERLSLSGREKVTVAARALAGRAG